MSERVTAEGGLKHYEVFLSHNSRDKPTVARIAEKLARAGLEPWLDKWSLAPGGRWQEELALSLSSDEAIARLNDLIRTFDEAAERHGVERVRTTRQSYLASCGLATPRVDNARRAVEFALELDAILERYSAQQGVKLDLRAGLDSGKVTSGLIGRARVVYDMWGDAVNLAFRVQGDSDEPGIYVTQRVADRLPDSIPVLPVGDVDTQSGTQRVWKVEAPAIIVEG